MIKQYKFAICDDDIQFCNKIKSYIIEYYGENKVEISIFNSGEDFIKSKVKYDCIFLDIEMINLNGIEIATMIRNYDLDTYIIIVSGFPKYKPSQDKNEIQNRGKGHRENRNGGGRASAVADVGFVDLDDEDMSSSEFVPLPWEARAQ